MQIMTRYAYMNAANGVNTPYPYQVELACLALDAGRLYDDLHPSTQKALHIAWRQAHEAFSSALRRAHALGVQARNSGDQPFATVHGQIIKGVALSWDDLTEHEQDALVIQWLRGKDGGYNEKANAGNRHGFRHTWKATGAIAPYLWLDAKGNR